MVEDKKVNIKLNHLLQDKNTYKFNSDCYSIDISPNKERPYFAAGFSDQTIRVW